tara:strand:- start:1738 stop:1950 length:213 start_codon:yes stop_codon:yes gene_type:complete
MSECKWVTLTVTKEELELIDRAKMVMEEMLGLRLSRNAYVRRLLFASVVGEGLIEGPNAEFDSKTILKGV